MLRKLLCTLNVGHHWLAEADADGNFRRRCIHCGKYYRRSATVGGRVRSGSHPPDPNDGMHDGTYPAPPFS